MLFKACTLKEGLLKACTLKGVRFKRRALLNTGALEGVRSRRRALKNACAQERVRSRTLALLQTCALKSPKEALIDLQRLIYHNQKNTHCGQVRSVTDIYAQQTSFWGLE